MRRRALWLAPIVSALVACGALVHLDEYGASGPGAADASVAADGNVTGTDAGGASDVLVLSDAPVEVGAPAKDASACDAGSPYCCGVLADLCDDFDGDADLGPAWTSRPASGYRRIATFPTGSAPKALQLDNFYVGQLEYEYASPHVLVDLYVDTAYPNLSAGESVRFLTIEGLRTGSAVAAVTVGFKPNDLGLAACPDASNRSSCVAAAWATTLQFPIHLVVEVLFDTANGYVKYFARDKNGLVNQNSILGVTAASSVSDFVVRPGLDSNGATQPTDVKFDSVVVTHLP